MSVFPFVAARMRGVSFLVVVASISALLPNKRRTMVPPRLSFRTEAKLTKSTSLALSSLILPQEQRETCVLFVTGEIAVGIQKHESADSSNQQREGQTKAIHLEG